MCSTLSVGEPEEGIMASELMVKEMLAEGQIIAYRLSSLGTEAAELWFTNVEAVWLSWDDTRPLLMLLDLRPVENVYPSAEAMMRARQFAQHRVAGRTAIVVRDFGETGVRLLEMFVDRSLDQTRDRDVFDDEAKAIAWLLQA
jgi:hypothetical protein